LSEDNHESDLACTEVGEEEYTQAKKSKKTRDHYLRLTLNQVQKLILVQKAILGRPTFQKIISGKIDVAYLIALRTLYEDKSITVQELYEHLQRVPQYLRDSLLDEIGEI